MSAKRTFGRQCFLLLPERRCTKYAEICKSKPEYHQHDIDRISAITNDYCYLFLDGMPALMREAPRYPYKRIMHTLESTELAEKLKVLKSGDNELYYAKYDNENFRNKINNNDPENFLTNYSAEINEILKSKGLSYTIEQMEHEEYIAYDEINSKIHELYETMDCIGFKRDNLSTRQDGTRNERKVRSSRHDIEHLLYAANADAFITADARLYYRAINIFKVLKKKVTVKKVHSFNELVQLYYQPD